MIQINKMVVINISGEDVQTLINVCETARIKMAGWKEIKTTGSWDKKEFSNMENFLNQIFDNA